MQIPRENKLYLPILDNQSMPQVLTEVEICGDFNFSDKH